MGNGPPESAGPTHPFWGGVALIGANGRLICIGSLHVQHSNRRELRRDVNTVVPIDLPPPILDDMLTFGRPNRPVRPWLGLYAAEVEDAIVVAGLAGFWRRVWVGGPADSEIPLQIARDGQAMTVRVQSADRTRFLKAPKFH